MKTTKLTNKEVIEASVVLSYQEVSKVLDDITVKEKLRVNKVFDALFEAYKEYEENRVRLVEEYAERDGNDRIIQNKDADGNDAGAKFPENSEFYNKVKELQDQENSVDFPVLSYGNLSGTKLPFVFIRAFKKVFTE